MHCLKSPESTLAAFGILISEDGKNLESFKQKERTLGEELVL